MAKTIIVTGGSRGIGKAIIQYFASQQYNIGFCGLNAEGVEKLSSELKQTHQNIKVYGKQVNMAIKSEVYNFGKDILEQFETIDILVNNAGTFKPGLIHTEQDGVMEMMMETNLYSAYYMSRVLIPKMIEQKSGHLFNICSIAGLKAYPNGGSYSLSKFAMAGLSKSLREELKEKNIRVTTVYPGAVLTDSWAAANLPPERFIAVEDIAKNIFDVYSLSERTVIEEIIIRPQLGDI